ncbi:glutathione S-transferase [Roseivivax halodurans JCM 10272]|uniref:Glutathione S-transferase n=1 Tax=Roseivivax halodurans JCM 10272 TaxID=1449350 RepID=X7EM23_9RHOB|nr:glutathione S-transferase family protein [Roseivivax halodurans]ETX16231.1 glutathione S-transferase [Roseivivax halodurans JCM 10272]
MSGIDFYTNPMSRGQIARWMLEEIGQPYVEHLLDWGPEGTASAGYRAVNPMMKVPCIVHEDAVVTEAAAIGLYLAHRFPEAELGPRGDEIAPYYRWILFSAGPVEQAVTARAMGWEVPGDRQKQGMLGFGSFERTVDALAGQLEGRDYVCGDRFTMADCYVGAQVDWGLNFGTLPERDAFVTYAERVRARPASKKARARDTELIEAAQAG